jgi:hypothetical protein
MKQTTMHHIPSEFYKKAAKSAASLEWGEHVLYRPIRKGGHTHRSIG